MYHKQIQYIDCVRDTQSHSHLYFVSMIRKISDLSGTEIIVKAMVAVCVSDAGN